MGRLDEADEFARLMFAWGWRADVEHWKGEKTLREGRKGDAAKHFTRATELNVPGDTWPLLDARLRLKALGAPLPPLSWEKKE